MHQRKELQKFVAIVITDFKNDSESFPNARNIYEQIKHDNPNILREEKIRGFKSFARLLPTFDGVERVGLSVRHYDFCKKQE